MLLQYSLPASGNSSLYQILFNTQVKGSYCWDSARTRKFCVYVESAKHRVNQFDSAFAESKRRNIYTSQQSTAQAGVITRDIMQYDKSAFMMKFRARSYVYQIYLTCLVHARIEFRKTLKLRSFDVVLDFTKTLYFAFIKL